MGLDPDPHHGLFAKNGSQPPTTTDGRSQQQLQQQQQQQQSLLSPDSSDESGSKRSSSPTETPSGSGGSSGNDASGDSVATANPTSGSGGSGSSCGSGGDGSGSCGASGGDDINSPRRRAPDTSAAAAIVGSGPEAANQVIASAPSSSVADHDPDDMAGSSVTGALASGSGHSTHRRLKCEECGATFSRMQNLKSHAFTHTNLRPFVCEECGHGFSRIHDLKRHQRLHSGARPYTCSHCFRSFARLDALNRHKDSNSCLNINLPPGLRDAAASLAASATGSVSSSLAGAVPSTTLARQAVLNGASEAHGSSSSDTNAATSSVTPSDSVSQTHGPRMRRATQHQQQQQHGGNSDQSGTSGSGSDAVNGTAAHRQPAAPAGDKSKQTPSPPPPPPPPPPPQASTSQMDEAGTSDGMYIIPPPPMSPSPQYQRSPPLLAVGAAQGYSRFDGTGRTPAEVRQARSAPFWSPGPLPPPPLPPSLPPLIESTEPHHRSAPGDSVSAPPPAPLAHPALFSTSTERRTAAATAQPAPTASAQQDTTSTSKPQRSRSGATLPGAVGGSSSNHSSGSSPESRNLDGNMVVSPNIGEATFGSPESRDEYHVGEMGGDHHGSAARTASLMNADGPPPASSEHARIKDLRSGRDSESSRQRSQYQRSRHHRQQQQQGAQGSSGQPSSTMSSLRREHRGGSRELERYNADSYPTSSGSSDVSTSMVQRQQTQFQAQLDRLANQNAWLLRRMQGLEQQVAVDRARIIDQQDQIQYLATESSLVRGGGQGHASDRSSHASSLELVAAAGMHRSSAGSLASYAIVNNGSGHGSGTPGHHPAHGMSAVAMGSSGTGGASATWSDRYPSSSTPSWRARPLQIEHHLQHHGPQAPSPNTAAAAARRPAAPQGGAAEFAGWSMRGDQYPPMQDGWSQQPPAFAPMPMRGELGMDSGDPDMMYGIMHLDQHQRPDQYDHVPLGSGPRAPSSATAAYSMTTRATQQSSYEALGPADMWGAAPTMSGGGDPRGGMPRMYDAPMDPYYVDPSARQMRRPRSNLSGGGGDAERPPSKRMRTSSSQQHADPMLQSG